VALCVVAQCGVVHAQRTNDDIFSGVLISAIAIDPRDTHVIYAGADKGVFKSTDGGTNWTSPGPDSPTGTTALVVDPQNSDTIWAVAYNDYNDGVFKSLDGGLSWTKVLNIVGGWTIAVDPKNSSFVFAGAGYGDIGTTAWMEEIRGTIHRISASMPWRSIHTIPTSSTPPAMRPC
jgi:photosystem II stability/assembly factor-like uncharacterized protein